MHSTNYLLKKIRINVASSLRLCSIAYLPCLGFWFEKPSLSKGTKGQGIVEQIDGAVEIDGVLYLVEMKWWETAIGRHEIAPHMLSVYGRGDVGGIFTSYSGFSAAAIEEAKTGTDAEDFRAYRAARNHSCHRPRRRLESVFQRKD